MSREAHVQFWESAEVKSLRATRLWQYSAPGKGVVFDFEMTRGKQVAKEFFKDYGGILHTDGYVAYEKDIARKI
jgi:hypothetical protein